MTGVAAALKIILKEIKTLTRETVKLTASLGRVLAEDIYADTDIPAFDNSAMDGYALRWRDTQGASPSSPKILEVVEDLKAGQIPRKKLRSNQASRIMTGAVIPKGADSVVIVENTERLGRDKVRIFQKAGPGENIRRVGEDIKKGERALLKGTLLNPAHIGILASLGVPEVKVTRQPMVAILATGDELVNIGKKLALAQLYSSNTYTLCAQVLQAGALPMNLGIARDNLEELRKKIKQGLSCDLLLTSGGVSVGDYDLVKDVLKDLGTEMKFWKVAMRPGKPLVFGLIKGKPVFGLPGNPVSSMVVFEVFVRPVILKMLGQSQDNRKEVDAVLEEDLKKKKGVRYFVRAKTLCKDGVYLARPCGPHGSAILKSMALANSLIILPEEEEFIEKGTRVTVRFLE